MGNYIPPNWFVRVFCKAHSIRISNDLQGGKIEKIENGDGTMGTNQLIELINYCTWLDRTTAIPNSSAKRVSCLKN